MKKAIIKMEQPEYAAKLFAGWEETPIWSCLQGVMGSIYSDHPKQPSLVISASWPESLVRLLLPLSPRTAGRILSL